MIARNLVHIYPLRHSVSRDFGFSLDQVNWLTNVVSFIYIPSSLVVPIICMRYGIRVTVRLCPYLSYSPSLHGPIC